MKDKKNKIIWKKLDNASKIFPAIANNKDTKVYRIAAELHDEINSASLQEALDLTLKSFPIYKSVLRRGFFWYYFESSNIRARVEEESTSPCSSLYVEGQRNLLFRISYYKRRINFELFHALSDGVGAKWFLETLVYHYISINYKEELGGHLPELEYGASISQKMDDSFWKNYRPTITVQKKNKREKQRLAYKVRGKRTEARQMKVIEGLALTGELLQVSKTYGVSLTVFLTSLFLYSIYMDMPKSKVKKPVVLSVPINLRPFYESSTARNFFSTMNISYDFEKQSSNFKDILAYVDKEFKKELSQEKVNEKLTRFLKYENNILARIVPLFIKDIFMDLANRLNSRCITASISNIGKIQVADEFKKYVRRFTLCISANMPKITICSYGDRIAITFTSPYLETDIQRIFFQFLSERDIKIEITSNM